MIQIKRIYKDPVKADGYRILVDRLWPRGVSKEYAKIDLWLKEVTPSDKLRKWYSQTVLSGIFQYDGNYFRIAFWIA